MYKKRVGKCFTCGHPTIADSVAQCPKCVMVSELIAELIRKQTQQPGGWIHERRMTQIA